MNFGVDNISVTVNYLKEQIEAYFQTKEVMLKLNVSENLNI